MQIRLSRVTLFAKQHPLHLKTIDVEIKDGIITNLSEEILSDSDYEELKVPGLCISPGWLDIGAQFGEPGLEERETIASGTKAAIAGGFTSVALTPNTHPVVQGKAEVAYLLNRAKELPIDLLVLGALTENLESKFISSMFEMETAGAIGFSNGDKALNDLNVLIASLRYASMLNKPVFIRPEEQSLSSGYVHEGKVATQLGIKTRPALGEYAAVGAALDALAYAGGNLVFHKISSEKGINRAVEAKKNGNEIAIGISVNNLFFSDENLVDFDTNFKVLPVLRTPQDNNRIISAIKNGDIAYLCSDHQPLDQESKFCEFDLAKFGASGLESAFALARTATKDQIELADLVSLFSEGPYQVLGLAVPEIAQEKEACLTLFHPDFEWTFESEHIAGAAHNYPALGKNLVGKPMGIIHKKQINLNL